MLHNSLFIVAACPPLNLTHNNVDIYVFSTHASLTPYKTLLPYSGENSAKHSAARTTIIYNVYQKLGTQYYVHTLTTRQVYFAALFRSQD